MSLFELPVSRGARLARVAAVLVLDLVLAGAGVAMILSYLDDRAEAARRVASVAEEVAPPEPVGDVDVLEPAAVDAEEVKREPAKRAHEVGGRGAGGARGTGPAARGAGAAEEREPSREEVVPAGDDDPRAAGSGADADDPAGDIDTGGPVGGGEPDGTDPTPADDVTAGDDGTLEPEPVESVAGEFSPARVRRVVDRHRVQLQKCYQRAAKSASLSKPLEGRVDVQFVIMPDGHASNVRPVADTTGSDQLAACVAGLIESWQFPSPGAEEIAFVWPFVFRAP